MTDRESVSHQGVKTTKSKSFFTPALLISFPMVVGKFSPQLTRQGVGGQMSFNFVGKKDSKKQQRIAGLTHANSYTVKHIYQKLYFLW